MQGKSSRMGLGRRGAAGQMRHSNAGSCSGQSPAQGMGRGGRKGGGGGSNPHGEAEGDGDALLPPTI